MFRDKSRLRDQIVFLEVADARHVGMNAKRYLAAARSVRTIVERELGCVTMDKFIFANVPALQTTAENIYFDSYGCFADLDGSGQAVRAQEVAEALIARRSLR